MKSITRRNGRSQKSSANKAGKARWLPTDNTRPQVFPDRRAKANKAACRGKVAW
jgi:hypothetical protein